ncbi:galactose-1-epimerase [Providencia rettgeri]|uniref:galactose-1-epimerase n=1 Tax=Providencia rettgeri TaxID=587 RepID=UPI00235F154B|nr:galactose-1-epimerase [Providencia rettgeri]ELR5149603.1 galactose-1-epimerase [Providencia rettgeri]
MQKIDFASPAPTVVTLTNRRGMQITLTNLGASWLSCVLPLESGQRDVVLGSPNIAKQREQAVYLGATVGRVANRIENAQFSINGIGYKVTNNQGSHCLHGGKDNFSYRIWGVSQQNARQVTFSLVSPDGDQGFPGELKVEVIYELTEENQVVIRYQHQTTQACPVNLTNHTYFNLAGEGAGKTVLGHELEIQSDSYLPTDLDGIPTGEWKNVTDTYFDFRCIKTIGRNFLQDADQKAARGYDHTFILDETLTDGQQPVASLYSPDRDVRMDILTTMPSMQLYTGNYLNSVAGKTGEYTPYSGVAFETQFPPNAVNHPEWGSQYSPISQPEQIYINETSYQFIF